MPKKIHSKLGIRRCVDRHHYHSAKSLRDTSLPVADMAAVNITMNGERTNNSKTYSKSLENGLLPAVAEKLELEETVEIVRDNTEAMDDFEEEEPPVGEIKVWDAVERI